MSNSKAASDRQINPVLEEKELMASVIKELAKVPNAVGKLAPVDEKLSKIMAKELANNLSRSA